jgi:predicted phosphodiesterase
MTHPHHLAVISDVHGNRWALAAVLEDIQARGIERAVNLGDSLYGPLDPGGTADLLLAHPMPTVGGNQDRVILAAPAESDPPTLRFVRAALRPEHFTWLAALPARQVIDDRICLFHASPEDDGAYFLWNVGPSGAVPRPAGQIIALLGSIPHPVILCGHDHVPAERLLPDGRLIVNPGSVGLPAYSDDQPFEHLMQAGSPHARYAIVAQYTHGWRIDRIAVPYDWQRASKTAAANGRPDWAAWLRSGWAG